MGFGYTMAYKLGRDIFERCRSQQTVESFVQISLAANANGRIKTESKSGLALLMGRTIRIFDGL